MKISCRMLEKIATSLLVRIWNKLGSGIRNFQFGQSFASALPSGFTKDIEWTGAPCKIITLACCQSFLGNFIPQTRWHCSRVCLIVPRIHWVRLLITRFPQCLCTIRSDKDTEGIAWASTASSHAQAHLAGRGTDIALGL